MSRFFPRKTTDEFDEALEKGNPGVRRPLRRRARVSSQFKPFDIEAQKKKTYVDLAKKTYETDPQRRKEMVSGPFHGYDYFYAYGWREKKDWKGHTNVKLFVDGPYNSEKEALLAGQEMNLDMLEVHESKSRDRNKATKEVASILTHQRHMPVEDATDRKYRR